MNRPLIGAFALLLSLIWVTGCASTTQEGFVIINATPRHAQVYLDGRLLGSTGDVSNYAFAVSPGRHTVKIVAPGFRPYRTRFSVDAENSTRLRVVLRPQ